VVLFRQGKSNVGFSRLANVVVRGRLSIRLGMVVECSCLCMCYVKGNKISTQVVKRERCRTVFLRFTKNPVLDTCNRL
jgi:hypothetical protein